MKYELHTYNRLVTFMCPDLRIRHSILQGHETVVNKEGIIVIDIYGNCNIHGWNRNWVPESIKEFNEAGRTVMQVQELFPNPLDFIKFYKKVCKEIENDKYNV